MIFFHSCHVCLPSFSYCVRFLCFCSLPCHAMAFHAMPCHAMSCHVCIFSSRALYLWFLFSAWHISREGNHRRDWNGFVMFLLTFHRQSRNKSIIGFTLNCVHVRSIGKSVQKTHKTNATNENMCMCVLSSDFRIRIRSKITAAKTEKPTNR